jgi:hypothetical protein
LKTTESVRVSPIPAQVKQRTRERGASWMGRARGGRRRASARKIVSYPKAERRLVKEAMFGLEKF